MSDIAERLQMHKSWRDSHGELNDAPNEAAAEIKMLRDALRTAVGHIEHMAAWIGNQNAGYSFESLGEDMPGIRASFEPPKKEN